MDIISFPGFKLISQPRKEPYLRKSGGLAIFIKDDIANYCKPLETESDYILWISLDKSITNTDENIILGTIYVPPAQSRFYNDDEILVLENEIMSLCSNHKYVFITGDINARTARLCDFTRLDPFVVDMFDIDDDIASFFDKTTILEDLGIPFHRVSHDNKTNNSGYWLTDLCKNNNIFIVNGRFGKDKEVGAATFRDKSVIDYTLCTADSLRLLNDFEIVELDSLFSDGHALLSWSLKSQILPAQNAEASHIYPQNYKWSEDSKNHFINSLNESDINSLRDRLEHIKNNDPESNHDPLSDTINQITNSIADIFDRAASNSLQQNKHFFQRKSSDKPWFGPACKIARKKYHRARKIYNQTKSLANKVSLKHESKQYKQTMNRYINKFKYDKIKKLRSMQTKNPKAYWNYLKSLQTNTNHSTPSTQEFYDHFQTVNKSNEPQEHVTFNLDSNTILNSKITLEEINQCIKHLKNGKACGEDKILNEYIKHSKHLFLPIYEKLFNIVFDSGIIPNAWLEGTIRPLYKNKGDSKHVQNYRPITILSCLGKLFTAILNTRLTDFLDSHNTILENQAGFRKGYATSDHTFVLHSLIELLKKRKQKLFCAFIDFSQAFDSIWRVGLWRKLLVNGVDGKFFRLVSNMYKNIKSCVKNNGETSAFFASQCGVRQGENLSPVLFAMYLNDLESYLLSGGVETLDLELSTQEMTDNLRLLLLLYADDTAIFSNNKENFQKCLDEFNDYCSMWKLNINFTKTEIVIFNSRNDQNYLFSIGEHRIKITDKYKYLGIILSRSGSFLNARKHLAEQARKAMHLLFLRANNLDIPIDLQLKLFDNTVLPILTYGSEIWGFENTDIIERVHLDFLRRIMKCRKSTPKYMLYAELGRYPLDITIKCKMINFWTRLLMGKTSKLSYNMYLFMLKSDEINSKWISYIQTILDNTGRHDLWLHHPARITLSTCKLIKQNLLDQFLQNWNSLLMDSSKGRNYNLFKSDNKCETYLSSLTGTSLHTMFKFRTANHKLPIETGRWNNVELSERKCQLCERNHIGDEFHYLLECTFFRNERRRYIDQQFYRSPNVLKFKQLLQTTDTEKLISLSQFMKIIMHAFK